MPHHEPEQRVPVRGVNQWADGEGVVLADEIKCLDWRVRRAKKKGKAPVPVVRETLEKLLTLLE